MNDMEYKNTERHRCNRSRIYRALLLAAVMIFIWPCSLSAKVKAPKKDCHAYVVMDGGTGKVLFGQKYKKKIYPASTAKLMTAIVCIENGDVDSMIKTEYDIVNGTTPGTYSVGIPSGVKFSFRDLLNLSLIASSADATDSLAAGVFGSKKKCAEAMCKKTKELGLTHTSFDNPVGNDIGAGFKKTYATAKEMALITRYAMSVPMIRTIVAKPGYDTRYGADIHVNTTNWFIRGTLPYDTDKYRVIGSKSGTTNAAGHVFIATAMDKEGHEVICAYFGNVSKDSTFRSIRSLLDYTFDKYKKGKLTLTNAAYDIRCDEEAGSIYTAYADKDCFPVRKTGQFVPNIAVTRKQLARMMRKIDNLDGNKRLKVFVSGNNEGTVSSLCLARLTDSLFPNEYVSDEEEEKILAECEGTDGLSDEDKQIFASFIASGLAPDDSCRNPGRLITRKQALIYADKLTGYMDDYDISHPSGPVGEIDPDGSIIFHVTESIIH